MLPHQMKDQTYMIHTGMIKTQILIKGGQTKIKTGKL